MEDEFTTFGTAKLMLVNVSYDEAQAVSEQIADIGGVQSVSFDDTGITIPTPPPSTTSPSTIPRTTTAARPS